MPSTWPRARSTRAGSCTSPVRSEPRPIVAPNEYDEFPIVGENGELTRTVIVRINGAVDDRDAGYLWKQNYVITEDHYIGYLRGRPPEAVVPAQILAKSARRAACSSATRSPTGGCGRSCTGSGRASGPAAPRLGRRTQPQPARAAVLAASAGIPRTGARLTDYVQGFDRFLVENRDELDMNEPDAQVAPRDNPYFGLEYYDERFGAWFFGREAEGSKIITNLRAARLTLLHAESGEGRVRCCGPGWRGACGGSRTTCSHAADSFGPFRSCSPRGRTIPAASWPPAWARLSSRTWARARSAAAGRPARPGHRGRVRGGEREPAHHARPVRGVLPLPLPRARARTVRGPACPLHQPDRSARQLLDRDPRGRVRRPW